MTTENKTDTINIGGTEYNLADLSPGVVNAIGLYQKFQGQLAAKQVEMDELQAEVVKTQLAMQTIAAQITEAVQAEVAEGPAEDELVTDAEIK